ncbi:sulfite exporter TauE/SafE family protein [Zongyangia hominis]|uniref:Probable membrane transporter protein n=1 Tax=Zongyangia hominis TaxID=2763677 RepID=A0A926I7D7_9FIRM|nr:sulfite exporter TauE/SafE family protein [Zongyangia hominis]MBC8570989.1 sulfite exporter TauE/SafE family protein [Zongyangia hominis]
MAEKKKKSITTSLIGVAIGFLNGIFGSGGGMVAVPFLKASGLEAKKAHATSIAVIFFLSIFSLWLYMGKTQLQFTEWIYYIPGGVAGGILGAWLLPRIPQKLLRRIFGALIIFSAVRLLMR